MTEKRTEDTLGDSSEEASSRNHELDSDFVEGPEWKRNDDRNCVLSLLVKYKKGPGKKIVKGVKSIPCSWNFIAYWNFYTKSKPGQTMLHDIAKKYGCCVTVCTDDEDVFVFEATDTSFEQESDFLNFVNAVLDNMYKYAKQSFFCDVLRVDHRVLEDTLMRVKENEELLSAWIGLGEHDPDALYVVCAMKDKKSVFNVLTSVISKVKECYNNHEETVAVDFIWQRVLKQFGYLQGYNTKFPNVMIEHSEETDTVVLKGPRHESKAAADNLLELCGTACGEIHEKVFSPVCQFEAFTYPEMCDYIDKSIPKLPVMWIPNNITKKIHIFSKQPEQAKGVDKFIKGCVQERLYPLSKDLFSFPPEVVQIDELKKKHKGKIVIHAFDAGLLVTTADDIFETVDAELQEIIGNKGGIYGFPKELCTDMYVRAAVKYSEERKTSQSFLREFHIVDLDTEILQDIKASWEKWQKDPQAIDPERAADEYAKKHGSFYRSHGQGQGHRSHRQWATSSSAMQSTDFDVTLRGETLSAVKVVDMGKEDKFGRTIQKFQLGQELIIKIYKGSLVNTPQLDALVTSINTKGEKGYLGKLVEDAGGTLYKKSFEDKKRKKWPLKPGEIFKCKSGDIHVGCIINVVIDRLQSMMGSELDNYRLVIKTLLKNVNFLKDVKTMVMPLLGSGSLKVPSDDLDRCCSGFVQAVLDFCFDQKEPNIKEIHIVSTDENVCTSVEKAFRNMSVVSSSSDGRGKVNMSSSRRGTEESLGIYDASSSDNRSRSVSGSSSQRNSADPFDELADSRAKVHRNNSVKNVGSGSDNLGDSDEDSDDIEEGDTAISTSKPNPSDKKMGNLQIITS